MRIVHTVPHVCKEASGPSYSVSRLCEELGANHHRVRLLTIDERARRDAQTYRHQAFRSSPLFSRLGISRDLETSLARQAKRADVIHNHGLWMMPNVYSGTAAKASGTPLILSPRGTFSPVALSRSRRLKKTFWWLKQRAAVEQAKCLHATCEQEYHDIRAFGLKQPVAIIPNGVDVPAPRQSSKAPRQRTLLFLGRIHPIKGLPDLLDAWASLADQHPDWKLEIVGSDPVGHEAELRRKAEQLALPRITFAGPLYRDAKHRAYQDADLYVLPSKTENFGHTVAEALARAVPVITTTGTPWRPVVGHQCGWCVDASANGLIKGLRQAFNLSDQQRRTMGANGRAWMEDAFSWTAVAEQMTQTYAWAAGLSDAPDCLRVN